MAVTYADASVQCTLIGEEEDENVISCDGQENATAPADMEMESEDEDCDSMMTDDDSDFNSDDCSESESEGEEVEEESYRLESNFKNVSDERHFIVSESAICSAR